MRVSVKHKDPLLCVFAILFLEQPFLHFSLLFFDAFPAIDGAKVDEVESVHDESFFDLLVQLGVRVEAGRVVHL